MVRHWDFIFFKSNDNILRARSNTDLCFYLVDLMKKEKIVVDAKVYIFAMGMVQAFFKPRELPVLKQ